VIVNRVQEKTEKKQYKTALTRKRKEKKKASGKIATLSSRLLTSSGLNRDEENVSTPDHKGSNSTIADYGPCHEG